jgi:hypothetical protein
MTPRFKEKPNFDFSQLCPHCGYRIELRELLRLASHITKCLSAARLFDEMAESKPLSTSRGESICNQ